MPVSPQPTVPERFKKVSQELLEFMEIHDPQNEANIKWLMTGLYWYPDELLVKTYKQSVYQHRDTITNKDYEYFFFNLELFFIGISEPLKRLLRAKHEEWKNTGPVGTKMRDVFWSFQEALITISGNFNAN
jgi:hypothetical protein